jgi:F-type H+-transporting ATPase subunit b
VRIRTAIAGVLILALASIGMAAPAHAAESVGSCVVEVALEAEELRAQGLTDYEIENELESRAEACVEAPNPVLPDMVELIWISIAFAILLSLGLKFAYPAVAKAMEERSERIRADLEAAEQAKEAALAEQASYQASLADAKGEANRIIEEARAAAEALRAERTAAADAEAAEIRARAAAEAEAAKANALADLRSDLTALALGAAERVVGQSLDASTHGQLIDEYIDQVGSRN